MTTNASTEMRSHPHYHDTYYDLLEIEPDASGDAVKRAYRRKARELHPDANPDDPYAAERFDKITSAYEILVDDHQRAEYDRQIAAVLRRRARAKARAEARERAAQRDAGTADTTAEGGTGEAAEQDDPDDADERSGFLRRHRGRSRADREIEAEPPELPLWLANLLAAAMMTAPLPWILLGAPWLIRNDLGETPQWHLIIAVFAWTCSAVAATGLLWSRSPSVPKSLPVWRAPGWEGTALLIRLVSFGLLGWASTALLLAPHVGPDRGLDAGTIQWAMWVLTLGLCWLISGQVPARLGYVSRFDRYWGLRGNRLPRPPKRRRVHWPSFFTRR